MGIRTFVLGLLLINEAWAAPRFVSSTPQWSGAMQINTAALCATSKHTLDYLNKGYPYDPEVIHPGKIAPIPLNRVKATLAFICLNQAKMNDANFIKQHFEFIRWYPDVTRARQLATNKPLLKNLPQDALLMTKYYVHLANARRVATPKTPYALYGLPADESNLSLEEANAKPNLIRFKYGKQSVLKGALNQLPVPKLGYLSRDDLESALLQGTVVADFGGRAGKKIYNVHRNNAIAYDRTKGPYEQNRYWYFKQVDGIKGYGKDAEHKITVNPEVTFAADLNQLGLGKMLMIQYLDKTGQRVTRAGVLADTGGAFADNLYQVDYLAGSFKGREDFNQGTRHLPDYVQAYFMVVKQ